ncbi:MAG TPA: NAD(P)/FAD-dependent oxidoreductase [Vicinamibacterales bacterium]|nr:NAD(P)/FAD-dependent oxidoreductase [Vicinamibacterales bacterium]
MHTTGTIVIGGGQAGLAMSRCLVDRGIDHVVLERGRLGERWRSERWASLRLLTPNWQTRLPGFRYEGPDPDGYMTMPEVVALLEAYARSFLAPVEHGTTVHSVSRTDEGFEVTTDRDAWRATSVVLATGYCDSPDVPPLAAALAPDILQLVPTRYRTPDQLPRGGVLIVGASSSGIQLADEIQASGRSVTLAVGRHTRLPRMYRGRDILWWFDAMGIFSETIEQVYDKEISRRQPSLQLVGRPDHASLDLPILQGRGVRLTGRLRAVEGTRVSFADDLVAHTVSADVRLARLLQRIDAFARASGLDHAAPEPFVPFLWPSEPPESIDLRVEGIRTVIWATGFRRHYPWLHVPVLDTRGEILHDGGVTPVPGLYAMGLQFMRRRNSSFLDGVGADAEVLAEDIAEWLDGRAGGRIRWTA